MSRDVILPTPTRETHLLIFGELQRYLLFRLAVACLLDTPLDRPIQETPMFKHCTRVLSLALTMELTLRLASISAAYTNMQ